MTLHRRHTRSGNTSLFACEDSFTGSLGEAPSTAFAVNAVRIDEIAAQRLGGRVNFRKVDVEGAERLVLQGAEQVIAANRQIAILME